MNFQKMLEIIMQTIRVYYWLNIHLFKFFLVFLGYIFLANKCLVWIILWNERPWFSHRVSRYENYFYFQPLYYALAHLSDRFT